MKSKVTLTWNAVMNHRFNPLKHLDPLGTLAFFIFNFGWAKPVPISPGYFKNPRQGMLLTAIAGPGVNLILAALFALGQSEPTELLVDLVATVTESFGAFGNDIADTAISWPSVTATSRGVFPRSLRPSTGAPRRMIVRMRSGSRASARASATRRR